MTQLSMNGVCPECSEQYHFCEDCGGIVESCSKGCCYGPDGQAYLSDCVCEYSLSPDRERSHHA